MLWLDLEDGELAHTLVRSKAMGRLCSVFQANVKAGGRKNLVYSEVKMAREVRTECCAWTMGMGEEMEEQPHRTDRQCPGVMNAGKGWMLTKEQWEWWCLPSTQEAKSDRSWSLRPACSI